MSIRSNVDARRFDQRITIQRNTVFVDDNGNRSDVWADVVACWAAVDGKKVGERWQEPEIASGISSVSESTMWIRADIISRYAVTVADRVVWKSKVYDIKDIPDQQLRGRLAALIVREGVSNG